MLKASSLDLRFRLHHGLGRVLSESLACGSQSRFSSALSPAIHRASNAEHTLQRATAQAEVRTPDGQAVSLTYSYPRPGKTKIQSQSGSWKRGMVETNVHRRCPTPSTAHVSQKRRVVKLGRAQLYQSRDVDSRGHLYSQKTDRVRAITTDTSSIDLQVPPGDRKVSQKKTIGIVQMWLKEGAARRGGGVGREWTPVLKVRRMQMKRKPSLQPLEHEGVSADEGDVEKIAHIHALRNIIRTASSAEDAWNAYESLLKLEREEARGDLNSGQRRRLMSPTLLTRLSRILSRTQPRTRQLFLRYLSLLSRLRQLRPSNLIYTWEWNTLINLAGNGFRKTTLDMYNASLDIYRDFVRVSSSAEHSVDNSGAIGTAAQNSIKHRIKPDIYTYTTLLSIATRTRHAPAVQHATALMNASGLKPSRITYLSLARFRLETEGLNGVRDSLQTLSREGYEIGIDGVNIFIWAAGKEGQIESALKVYDELRGRIDTMMSTDGPEGADVSATSKEIRKISTNGSLEIEGLTLSHSVLPDKTTYTTLIQVLAYHGYLIQALRIFTDMLSVPIIPPDGEEYYQPTDAVFRALFRGFARYGNAKWAIDNVRRNFGLYSRELEWDMERLRILLDTFISMPEGSVKPRAREMYWAMVATEKCTNYDPQECREVWVRLKERFTFCMDGRMAELDRKYGQPE